MPLSADNRTVVSTNTNIFDIVASAKIDTSGSFEIACSKSAGKILLHDNTCLTHNLSQHSVCKAASNSRKHNI